MAWLLAALTALLVLDALRMRGRIGQLEILTESGAPASHRLVAPRGVTVAPATVRAASAYARDRKLDVVDLVPRDLPVIRAMTLVQLLDPARYRRDRTLPGRTAGHALLVSEDVAMRAGILRPDDDDGARTIEVEVESEIAFIRLAARLNHYGPSDAVIAPLERARPADLSRRIDLLHGVLGPFTALALTALPLQWALIGLGIWLRPLPGLIALAAWHVQPLIGLARSHLRPRNLAAVTLLRGPIELAVLGRSLLRRNSHTAAIAARRAEYEPPHAGDLARFHEPRRADCPICGSTDLVVHLRTGDLVQHKPGVFTIERCGTCRHLFQNPRLSSAGLAYYYKDFYDGLGADGMELLFGADARPYHTRARMLGSVAQPRRWLDVGAGHGHFCAAARQDLPTTRFDGLDLSESIDEARRRGWVDTAHRGMFPELAPRLAGHYDAISMSHYLEHTTDPRAELAAAHTALAPAGHLMIEVPDPEFVLARVLRRYWLPWFQPQHLNLLSTANLERLLRERGFLPVLWHRGAAHQCIDFFFAAVLLLNRIAPSPRLPWRWRGASAIVWHTVVWTAGIPLLAAGILLDHLLRPVFSRAGRSNTYRVVAVKAPAP